MDPQEFNQRHVQDLNQAETNNAAQPAESPDAPPDPRSFRVWLFFRLLLMALCTGGLLWVLFAFGARNLLVGALVVFGLGVVIFIHELGHFAVAKWCDVYVETFSIGFGPALPGCCYQKGETTYMIGIIPLGGYVKMLGEGAEDDPEGQEDNPRSYKNKTVPQRMAIISAGVIMNVIFGCIAFIAVYMTHGERQIAGVVGMVDAGSPAWGKSVPSGAIIKQIGSVSNPSFNDLSAEVPLSGSNIAIPFAFAPPGGPVTETTIEPRRNEDAKYPQIGIGPPQSLALPTDDARSERDGPYWANSAAARASPPLQFGDEIVAMTDPADPRTITDLPPNQHNPDSKNRDFFAFRERLQRLAGQEVTIRVKRGAETVDIRVPPAYQFTLGLRMRMGRVTAVRPLKDGSANPVQPGDVVKAVEVVEPTGLRTRWVLDHSPPTANQIQWLVGLGAGMDGFPVGRAALASLLAVSPALGEGVVERDLDPFRLPDELEQWALRRGAASKVTLTVGRTVDKEEETRRTLELSWDDRFRFSQEVPLGLSSPVSLPGLGIAYQIETTVKDVVPGSPATRARTAGGVPFVFQKGDLITEARFFELKKTDSGYVPEPERKPSELKKPYQWAKVIWQLQLPQTEVKRLALKVERGKETFDILIDAEEDRDWPIVDRGIAFMRESRLKKAEGLGQAIGMGYRKTVNFIQMVYMMIRRLVTRDISVETVGGPLMIFMTGKGILDYDFFEFVLFLGMISVNLAVVNFLPIPVLDGGHFVFLLYEWLRGKPASEKIRIATTYVGLFLIIALMGFVLWMDVKRYFL